MRLHAHGTTPGRQRRLRGGAAEAQGGRADAEGCVASSGRTAKVGHSLLTSDLRLAWCDSNLPSGCLAALVVLGARGLAGLASRTCCIVR